MCISNAVRDGCCLFQGTVDQVPHHVDTTVAGGFCVDLLTMAIAYDVCLDFKRQ